MDRTLRGAALLALLLGLSRGPLAAQVGPDPTVLQGESLRGLRGVAVIATLRDVGDVGEMDPEVKRNVEQLLRSEGVPVLNDPGEAAGYPLLLVQVVYARNDEVASHRMDVQLWQSVELDRVSPPSTVYAMTWQSVRRIGAAERDPDGTTEINFTPMLYDLLTQFIAAYKGANG